MNTAITTPIAQTGSLLTYYAANRQTTTLISPSMYSPYGEKNEAIISTLYAAPRGKNIVWTAASNGETYNGDPLAPFEPVDGNSGEGCEVNPLKAAAARKGAGADPPQPRWKLHGCEAAAALEGSILDVRQTRHKPQRCDVGAPFECLGSNASQAGGKLDASHVGAPRKRAIPDGCQTAGEFQNCQAEAAPEGVHPNVGETAWKANLCQSNAVDKRGAANQRQRRGKLDCTNCTSPKCAITNRCNPWAKLNPVKHSW